MTAFEGIWIPLVTPFRDGGVDLESLQRLAVGLVESGIHGLVVCGSTGEAATLHEDEQAAVLHTVLEAVGDRCPVVMGIGGSDPRVALDKVSRLESCGIAGFLISAPAYVRPSQQGIMLYFRAIAAATDLPIMLYNIPYRTGVNIETATIQELAKDAQFVAIKQCGDNMPQLMDLINNTPLKVLSGEDSLALVTLLLGGAGAIPAAAHIRPDLYVRIFELVKCGKIGPARSIFNTLLPLIRLLFSEPNPGPVKAALALQGSIREELRLPMTPVSDSLRRNLEAEVARVMTL